MDDITHPQLVAALAKAPLAILNTLSLTSIDAWHAATGISGECGELLEMLSAKYDHDNLIEELGDIEFYMEQLRQRFALARAAGADNVAAVFEYPSLTVNEMLREQAITMAIFASQILDTVKKMAIYNKEILINGVEEGLFRLDVCMGIIRRAVNVDRADVLRANISKLGKRYVGLQYTDQAAQERADKPEERKFFGKASLGPKVAV